MKSRNRNGRSTTVPGNSRSMADAALSRLYIGMRMSTWCGVWTMIQWRKKLNTRPARRTVVPSIWAANFVHSSPRSHLMSGSMWWTWMIEPITNVNARNATTRTRATSQATPATDAPWANPYALSAAAAPVTKPITSARSRLTDGAGFWGPPPQDHLVPPHFTRVVGAGTDERPLHAMAEPRRLRHRRVLGGRDRVPDEVVALAAGEA